MSNKTFVSDNQNHPSSQIGATFEALASSIAARRGAGSESYTHRLLTEEEQFLLGKITEEAGEVADAALEGDVDHLRYEAGDVLYHLLVLLERHNISLDELAAELNNRMTEEERPEGAIQLYPEYVNRGK